MDLPPEQIESQAEPQVLTQEAVNLLQSIPTDLAAEGPVAFAKHLVQAATLNKDQQANNYLTIGLHANNYMTLFFSAFK